MSGDDPEEDPNLPSTLPKAKARIDELSGQLTKLRGKKKTFSREETSTLLKAKAVIAKLVLEISGKTEPQASSDDSVGLVRERDLAIEERNEMRDELDQALFERDEALLSRTQAFADRDAALDRLTASGVRIGELEFQFANIPDPAVALQSANTRISALVAERDGEIKRRLSAETNVERLESVCGLKGLDPASLPICANDPSNSYGLFHESKGSKLYDEFKRLKGAEKTQFFRNNKTDLRAYAASKKEPLSFD